MKKNYLIILFLFLNLHVLLAQSNGVSSFDLPAKNSVKFNKYLISPTFSFVREEFSMISIYNKKQFSEFENAPQTIFGGYSGKFQDNNSFAIAGFQQSFGLLTTTGGIINYARNVEINDDSNFTFGLNIGIYKSGINTSKIITNSVDPLFAGFANNTIVSINPGINYGSGQIDFGITANNLVLYNFTDSKTVSVDPDKSFTGHFMFTGFVESNGIFDESKFTTLVRAENKKDITAISGLVAFEMPTIGWLQAGYSNLYGASAGVGFNILKNFSVGYNYQKTLGDAASLGISHEFNIAYTFLDSDSNDSGVVYVKPAATIEKPVVTQKSNLTDKEIADAKAKALADAAAAKIAADKLLKDKIASDAKTLADAKAQAIADAAAAKIAADKLLKEKTSTNSKSLAEAKAKAAADALAAKILADKLLKEKTLSGDRNLADTKAKAAAAAAAAKIESDRLLKEKLLADTKAIAAANAANAKIAADRKLKGITLTNAEILAQAKAKAAADAAAAKAAADKLLKDNELLGAKAIADAKAKTAADALAAKLETQRLLKEKEDLNEKSLAAAKAKAAADAAAAKAETERLLNEKANIAALDKNVEVENKTKVDNVKTAAEKAAADKLVKDQAIADAKIKADAAAKAKLEADKIKADADKIIRDKATADATAKAAADKLVKDQAIADAKVKADAAAKAKLEADKIKADADKILRDKVVANASAKAAADKLVKDQAIADAKIKADAAAKAKLEADKIKADADKIIRDKATADATAKAAADKLLKDQAIADAKIKADAAAKAKLEADKIKADADKILRDQAAADATAKAAADKLVKDQAIAEAKVKADAAAKVKLEADKIKAEADKILRDKAAADATAKAAADKLVKDQAIADAKVKADAAAKAKLEADKIKAEADKILRDKAAADSTAKAAADKLVKDQAVADAKVKADAASKAKLEADKIKADADKILRDKAAADAKAAADKLAKEQATVKDKNVDNFPKGDDEKSMDYINKILNDNGKNVKQLILKLDSIVVSKLRDLKDLKEENDLSDKGIFKDPKPFQSATVANRLLESIKTELSESNNTQSQFINQLQELSDERLKKVPSKTDPVNMKYLAAIEKLKAEQLKNENAKISIVSRLDQIKTEIDIEKKRRIKKAAFENGQGRYDQDRSALKRIKESTPLSKVALTPADFDFGTDDQSNMQILKRIENTQNGFYLILAVHNDISKRDNFIAKAVSAGLQNIDFFYDVSSSKYFIFTRRFETLEEISRALESKGSKPYNGKMFVVKIEN